MAWRKRLVNVLLLVGSTTLALLAAEWVYRRMLFSTQPAFAKLRDANLYADSFNEADHWKLYTLFGGEYRPPEDPHPLLGWRGAFKAKSLLHDDARSVGAKRPVLLYGDSYAQCMPEVRCFQDLLNTDTLFNREHHLLNYGVGGYGVDQITLLFEQTYLRYDRPFVVFSLMVSDMDRSPLDWRTGQKPWFALDGDGLRLQGVPIDPDPDHYLATHPVTIGSYLWRRFLYSPANVLPAWANDRLKGWSAHTAHKQELNTRILDRAIERLKASRVDFVVLVFHYLTPDQEEWMVGREDNWRDRLLRERLMHHEVPYIWSKDLILADPAWTGSNLDTYMLLDNGHPTTYFNGLIAAEIRKHVLEAAGHRDPRRPLFAPPTYVDMMERTAQAIRQDSAWLASVRTNAERDGQALEDRIIEEAWFVVREDLDVTGEAIRAYTRP